MATNLVKLEVSMRKVFEVIGATVSTVALFIIVSSVLDSIVYERNMKHRK